MCVQAHLEREKEKGGERERNKNFNSQSENRKCHDFIKLLLLFYCKEENGIGTKSVSNIIESA